MAKDDKKKADEEKTYVQSDVDPADSGTKFDPKEQRDGTSVDQGPAPTVNEAGKAAIEAVRATEREQALIAEREQQGKTD